MSNRDIIIDKVNNNITKRIKAEAASDFLREWVQELDPEMRGISRIERISDEFYKICLFGEREETRLKAIDMFLSRIEFNKQKDISQPMINLTIQNIDQKIDEYLGPKTLNGDAIDNKIKEIVE
ncbi:MAG: hypothetical protein ULS35scaffold63_8 [Phage 33_17]|nr:MAG: hypothetical protein ULS35scaffold63_8 [Phage 33_17]